MTTFSNTYSLMSEEREGETHINLKDIRRLTSVEVKLLMTGIEEVMNFDKSYGLSEICKSNYDELLQTHEKIKSSYINTRKWDDDIAFKALREINRKLLNYLSSFKTFIDHYCTRYTRLDRSGTSFFKAYKEATSFCFDNSFAYRFLSKLRDYSQHCGLPVKVVDANAALQADGSIIADFSMSFDRDALLRDFKKWGEPGQKEPSKPAQVYGINYLCK